MELEEMKNIWENIEEPQKIFPHKISQIPQVEYNKKANIFRTAEIIGLLIAYAFAGFILYKFNTFENWDLRVCAIFLVAYLLTMPLYTLLGVWKMKQIDLVESNYKTVLQHFYTTKSNLKKAEKISFIASPFLFIATVSILTKLFTDKNLFELNVQLPAFIFIGIAFVLAILFNIWAFKKRDQQLKSVKQLLEEDN